MEFTNLESLIKECNRIQEKSIDIYIVGAGKCGHRIANVLDKNKITWKCFIDKRKDNIDKIINYEECKDKEAFFIISSTKYKNDVLKDVESIIGVCKDECIASLDDLVWKEIGGGTYIFQGGLAIEYVLKNEKFETVLDVGCGEGIHSEIFIKNGKLVTALDYGQSLYFKKRKNNDNIKLIIADINKFESDEKFDLVWCSHVLEHQLNAHDFLCKLHSLLKENGILAITVPPYKGLIEGGHVSIWNAGILLYHLVLAGFDCSKAHIKTDEKNISVVVRKHTINILDRINYDVGDIRKIRRYLPEQIDFMSTKHDEHFWGDIKELNWK